MLAITFFAYPSHGVWYSAHVTRFFILPALISLIILCIMSAWSFISLKKGALKPIGILFAIYAAANLTAWIYELQFMMLGIYHRGWSELAMIWETRAAYPPFILACVLLPLTLRKSTKPLRAASIILISIELLDILCTYLFSIYISISGGDAFIYVIPDAVLAVMYISLYTALMITVVSVNEKAAVL